MPALQTSSALNRAYVSDRTQPAPGIVILGVRAADLAAVVRPGQFVMALPPGGERVATALGVFEVTDERVSFMLVVVGPRTRELAALAPGDALDVLGPLGNGFDTSALGEDLALVAGGVGIAPLLLAASAARDRDARVTLYYGARDARSLVGIEPFAARGVAIVTATDDGSAGRHGFVTEPLRERIASHDALAACGPSPMLRAVARIAAAANVPAQLSLEETFACGVGACWGCVVPVARESVRAPDFPPPPPGETRDYVHARICMEGPVFWAHDLRW